MFFTVSSVRQIATLSVMCLMAPLFAGCATQKPEDMGQGPTPLAGQPSKPGLSKGQKTALLVGAAALYYIYKQRQQAPPVPGKPPTGISGQLYRSESTGGIYYRDPQGKAVWVSPPKAGISVPADVAARFQQQYREEIGKTTFKPGSEPLPAW